MTGNRNTFIGYQAHGEPRVTNSTAIGADAVVSTSNSLVLGSDNVRVGIGFSGPAYKLHVNGTIAGMGPYIDASDLRYKRDFQSLTNPLEKVLSLRGVSYEWNQAAFPTLNFTTGRQIGFVAQEVEQVLPEVVYKDPQGFYSVAYSSVVPLLVEAIKQQQKEAQEKIAQIEQENILLRERLAALERLVEKLHMR